MFFDAAGNINGVNGSGAGSVMLLLQYSVDKWYAFRFELDKNSNQFGRNSLSIIVYIFTNF